MQWQNHSHRHKASQKSRAVQKASEALIRFLVVEWMFTCDQYDNQHELSLDPIDDQVSKQSLLQLEKNEAD